MKRRELEAEVARLREEADRVRGLGRVWRVLCAAVVGVMTLGMYAVIGVTALAGVLGGVFCAWLLVGLVV